MSGIQAVTPGRHANLRWRRFGNYRHAVAIQLAPLAAAELSQAALHLPLAFIRQGEGWALVAVLGLLPEQNLFVDPQGHWLAVYVPATLRGHPFLIGTRAGGEPTLCVDEASGLVTPGPEGEPFFDDVGQLAPNLQQVWTFLTETARSEALLAGASDALARAGVIEPWPITVRSERGTQAVEGLHRINEGRLNGLADATYIELRRQGVLGLAYAQLLSAGHLTRLGQLAQARAQAEAAERARAEVKPMITLPNDSTIDWDWSKIGR